MRTIVVAIGFLLLFTLPVAEAQDATQDAGKLSELAARYHRKGDHDVAAVLERASEELKRKALNKPMELYPKSWLYLRISEEKKLFEVRSEVANGRRKNYQSAQKEYVRLYGEYAAKVAKLWEEYHSRRKERIRTQGVSPAKADIQTLLERQLEILDRLKTLKAHGGGSAQPHGGRHTGAVLLHDAVASLTQKRSLPLAGSLVKDEMLRMNPGFSEKRMGFSSFSRFLEMGRQAGVIKLRYDKLRGGYSIVGLRCSCK